MSPPRAQQTVARPAAVTGKGYWSGENVTVEFRPAPVGSGVRFVRDDLPNSPGVPASIAHQKPADRRTILHRGDARVEMIEHILAALAGMGVDNCEVGVTAAEAPGLDGSSLAFVEAIGLAGIEQQGAPTTPLVVTRPVRLTDGDRWIEARPPIGDCLSIEYDLDYGAGSPIHRQWFVAEVTLDAFCDDIAPARTFLLEAEADAIRERGLARHVTPHDLLIFGPEGPLENTLRFADECARHKTLDVVGDLAMAGRPILAHIVARRSGHRLNGDLVRALLSQDEELSRRLSA